MGVVCRLMFASAKAVKELIKQLKECSKGLNKARSQTRKKHCNYQPLVLTAGLEPARDYSHRFLRPKCLPIPPCQHIHFARPSRINLQPALCGFADSFEKKCHLIGISIIYQQGFSGCVSVLFRIIYCGKKTLVSIILFPVILTSLFC